jgi:hypothetical protein
MTTNTFAVSWTKSCGLTTYDVIQIVTQPVDRLVTSPDDQRFLQQYPGHTFLPRPRAIVGNLGASRR